MGTSATIMSGEMASRLAGVGAVGTETREVTAPLLLEAHFRGRVPVVRPVGELVCEPTSGCGMAC